MGKVPSHTDKQGDHDSTTPHTQVVVFELRIEVLGQAFCIVFVKAKTREHLFGHFSQSRRICRRFPAGGMFENVAKKANNELFGKLTDYMGGVSAVLDKIALVLEAKYGVDMLPSNARKRKSQEILEAHLEPFLEQQTSQHNLMPDMQAAANGQIPPGVSVQQMAQNPFGQQMLEQAMVERGVRIREASRQSAMMIDGQ